jgi:hypothetical protein
MPARTPYYVAISDTAGVMVQMVEASVDPLASLLGYTKCPTGEAPSGKTALGSGRADALAGGCFAVNVVYRKGTKEQSAKVLVSPTKASAGLFGSLKGAKYNTNDIVKVRVPRRRVYTF